MTPDIYHWRNRTWRQYHRPSDFKSWFEFALDRAKPTRNQYHVPVALNLRDEIALRER